jgi:hypothetical protein
MRKTFEVWMTEVDNNIANVLCGMTSSDLPDVCYMDWYENGMTPKAAARKAIKNTGE